jgi:6-phosphogluconolactonase
MSEERLYVGTHRRAHRADPVDIAFGIYLLCAAPNGGWRVGSACVETAQPGWIARHPSGRWLYSVNEVTEFEGRPGGGVSAFAIDPDTGVLTFLNSQRTPPLPCHCAVDATGRHLLVASLGGGSVHLFPLETDGRIGPQADAHTHVGSSVHPKRQTRPHAHAVNIDPDNRFVAVPDLGIDKVRIYALDPDAQRLVTRPELTVDLPLGSGPRHLVFDAAGRFAYLMNELSATVTAFRYQRRDGALQAFQSVDLMPEGFEGHRSGAEIRIHPQGRFLYATTRSHGSSGEPAARGLDALLWFEIDASDGRLRLRGREFAGGEIPRSFAFDRSGTHILVGHQASGTIASFRLDLGSGAPTPTGEVVETPVPVCLCAGA